MSTALFTTEYGTAGPRLVFLHGLFGQGKNWTSTAKALAEPRLGPGARVTLVDLPNHGRSPWTADFSYSAMAAEVAGMLRERYPGEAVGLVGHSMGGKVAMMLALEHPGLVERLAVVDVSPVAYDGLRGFARYVEGMRSLDLDRLPDRSAAQRALAGYVEDRLIRGFLLQNLRRTENPDRPWRWQMNLDLLGDHLAEIGDWPETVVTPYEGPVLWIAGDDSDYVRPEFGPAMRALFPRTQLVTVKGAGHWVHAEQPEIFQAAIRRFAGLEPVRMHVTASGDGGADGTW